MIQTYYYLIFYETQCISAMYFVVKWHTRFECMVTFIYSEKKGFIERIKNGISIW